MRIVCILLIFSVVYSAGNPLRLSSGKEKQLKEDIISNLELLIPLKENQFYKNKKLKHLRGSSVHRARVDALSDGPYTKIPDNEFVLDDSAVYFKGLQKTNKKDLSQVDQSKEENDSESSTAHTTHKDDKSSEALLQKCRKYLRMELLRSQWESIIQHPLGYDESHSEDKELLFSLCRIHLGLANKHSEDQKPVQLQSMPQNAGNLGVGGFGGVAGNIGVGGEGDFGGNVAVNGQGGVAGNVGIKGTGGVAGNVGMVGKGSHTSNTWGDSVAFQMINGMGFNAGNIGLDGQGGFAGNAGFNGEGGSAGNVGIGGKGGQAGNFGVGGKGGIVGNLGIGGQGGFFGNVGVGSNANQHFDFYSGGGLGKFLANLVPGFHSPTAKDEAVKKFSLVHPSMNQPSGLGQKENYMQLGLGASSASHGGLSSSVVGNGEQYGNVGMDGEGGIDGNVAVAGQENVENLVVEGGAGNEGYVVLGGQGTEPNMFVENRVNSEIVGQNLKQVAKNDDNSRFSQNNVPCYVGSLAHGGKGGQIGNLAISGGALGNSQYPRCGHSHCVLVYLVLNPKEARSEADVWSLWLVPGGEQVAGASASERLTAVAAGTARPGSGRRDWMTMGSQIDPRLKQYMNDQ